MISDRLGHSDIRTTIHYYMSVTDADQRQAVDAWAEYLRREGLDS